VPSVPEFADAHHLYVCPEHSRELRRHLSFRDALRGSAQLRQDYEKLKMSFAGRSVATEKFTPKSKKKQQAATTTATSTPFLRMMR